jgi:hypothetical protein
MICWATQFFPRMYMLSNTAGGSNSRGGGSFAPKSITARFRIVGKQFRLGRQEDGHEFLRCLLQRMVSNACRTAGVKEGGNADSKGRLQRIDETTFVNRIFGGYFRNQLRCADCGFNSNTFDAFLDLSLEIGGGGGGGHKHGKHGKHSPNGGGGGGAGRVDKALRRFVSAEVLDEQNKWKCPRCKRPVCARKQMTIRKPPAVLTIQLKRFAFNPFGGGGMLGGMFGGMFGGGGGRKIQDHVNFEETLDLSGALSDSAVREGAPCLYDLHGIIVHHGGSANSGHYFAYVKAPNGTWACMDDDSVTAASWSMVQRQQAYVLLYTQRKGQRADLQRDTAGVAGVIAATAATSAGPVSAASLSAQATAATQKSTRATPPGGSLGSAASGSLMSLDDLAGVAWAPISGPSPKAAGTGAVPQPLTARLVIQATSAGNVPLSDRVFASALPPPPRPAAATPNRPESDKVEAAPLSSSPQQGKERDPVHHRLRALFKQAKGFKIVGDGTMTGLLSGARLVGDGFDSEELRAAHSPDAAKHRVVMAAAGGDGDASGSADLSAYLPVRMLEVASMLRKRRRREMEESDEDDSDEVDSDEESEDDEEGDDEESEDDEDGFGAYVRARMSRSLRNAAAGDKDEDDEEEDDDEEMSSESDARSASTASSAPLPLPRAYVPSGKAKKTVGPGGIEKVTVTGKRRTSEFNAEVFFGIKSRNGGNSRGMAVAPVVAVTKPAVDSWDWDEGDAAASSAKKNVPLKKQPAQVAPKRRRLWDGTDAETGRFLDEEDAAKMTDEQWNSLLDEGHAKKTKADLVRERDDKARRGVLDPRVRLETDKDASASGSASVNPFQTKLDQRLALQSTLSTGQGYRKGDTKTDELLTRDRLGIDGPRAASKNFQKMGGVGPFPGRGRGGGGFRGRGGGRGGFRRGRGGGGGFRGGFRGGRGGGGGGFRGRGGGGGFRGRGGFQR